MAKWLDKYEQGGLVLKQKTKDNYNKQSNYNDADASVGPGFKGLAYNLQGRNYSPAWGGQFQNGGKAGGKPTVKEIMQIQPRKLNIQDQMEEWLGNPMDKAVQATYEYLEPGEDARDNIRHPMAGRFTSEAIQDKLYHIPIISQIAGFIGGSAAGLGHELIEPNRGSADRPYSKWDTFKEGAEDQFNNMIGAAIGSTPFISSAQKDKAIKYLSDHNMIPDGYRDKNNMYIKHAMGGSLPGSVGFMYARTQNPAPANGKYAKKTLASAQDGIDLQKAWLTSYLQSPKYKERLGKEFAGQSDEFIQQENDARLNNLLNAKTKYVKSIGNSPGWISGMMVPKENKGEIYDNASKKFIKNKWSPGARGYDKKGTVYLENEYRPDHWNPSEGFETTPLHELGHAVDDAGYRIPASTEKKIHNYTDWQSISKSLNLPNYKNNGLTFDYYNTPSEFINRIQPIRYLLNKEGLYDARTSDFTEKDYDNMLKNKNLNNNQHYKDVMNSLKGDKKQKKKAFVDLMNTVAKVDNNENVDAAQDGKELSKNDNIPSTSSARNKLIADEISKKAIAKKRIDAVQNTSQEFMQDWMNSPMYKQMLSNSAKGSEFEAINKGRQQNLQGVMSDPNVFNIADLNEDNDYIDNLLGHRLLGEAALSKTGKFKIQLDKELAANKNLAKQIGVHEVSHTTDFNGNIPSSDINKMKSYKKASDKAKSKTSIPVIDNSEFNDYLAKPTETRARLNTLRYLGKEKGIYDPFTEKIDKTKLHKFNSIFSKDKSLSQLRDIYSDDQIIDMLNSVSKNDSKKGTSQDQAIQSQYSSFMENGGEMQYYQEGLDWKPKSISKNGSVIKDDRGQWAHPGEITEINSNDITMEGVDYPVLGVSDTGDTKLMQPGKNYKFMGKKVTEFPMAQSGKKLTAKQIKQNEEFLQNQKSFYDYLTQNDRQDYPIDYTNQYPALKSDATRNVIPRKMTDKEKLEAVAISDQAQKRALNTAKEVIAERKRNASQKGDLKTPGSWHTEDKGRLFPESVGGLGEMYDDYLNPLTIVGSLADAAGESIAARDPKSLALTLGMAGGLGALGFSPLNDAIALKGGVDNLFKKGVTNLAESLANKLRRPGTPLNTYYDDLVPQLALPTTERMALPSTQRMGLPYSQQLGLPQPALQQAINRAAQNLGRVPYQEPTAAELAEMNLREANRYAPRVDRTGRQRMGTPDDMRALYNPPAQQATISFGETQPVDYDNFDWAVDPYEVTADEMARFRERLRQSEQRQLASNMYNNIFDINIPTQRMPDPSTYTNIPVDITPEEIAMSNTTSSTEAPATAAPTATPENTQSSFIQKGYALNSEPVGSYQTVDPTSENKINYDIQESERDGIKGTFGDYTMRDANDGYFHFGLFKPNDPNEYARISPGMTFRNEGPGATKQLQMMMSRLPKKVEIPFISTSIYSTPLMDSHFSRLASNQPGRLTLKDIKLHPLNDWKREQDGKSYIEQIIDQFPKIQKWSKKLSENTGYQLPEPVINFGSNPVTIDELKAIQNNKGNYSVDEWYDLNERLHVLAPKYNVKKHWRNGGSSNWLDKYK